MDLNFADAYLTQKLIPRDMIPLYGNLNLVKDHENDVPLEPCLLLYPDVTNVILVALFSRFQKC